MYSNVRVYFSLADSVTVTSIKYLSQAGTLAVGFNFGSFQLWRLYNPVLE